MIGSGNFVILVLDVINLPLCTAHTSASPESIHQCIFQSVVLRSCVTSFSKCVEVGLVKRVHTLFGRNAQQVVYELQVREEVEGVRQEVREVKGGIKVEGESLTCGWDDK